MFHFAALQEVEAIIIQFIGQEHQLLIGVRFKYAEQLGAILAERARHERDKLAAARAASEQPFSSQTNPSPNLNSNASSARSSSQSVQKTDEGVVITGLGLSSGGRVDVNTAPVYGLNAVLSGLGLTGGYGQAKAPEPTVERNMDESAGVDAQPSDASPAQPAKVQSPSQPFQQAPSPDADAPQAMDAAHAEHPAESQASQPAPTHIASQPMDVAPPLSLAPLLPTSPTPIRRHTDYHSSRDKLERITEYRSICPSAGPSALAAKYRQHQARPVSAAEDAKAFAIVGEIEPPAVRRMNEALEKLERENWLQRMRENAERKAQPRSAVQAAVKVELKAQGTTLCEETIAAAAARDEFQRTHYGFLPNPERGRGTLLPRSTEEKNDWLRANLTEHASYADEEEKAFSACYYRRCTWFREDYLFRDLVKRIYPSFGTPPLAMSSLGATLAQYYNCHVERIDIKASTWNNQPHAHRPWSPGMGSFTAACVRFLWFAYPQVIAEEDKRGILRVCRYAVRCGIQYFAGKEAELGHTTEDELADWVAQMEVERGQESQSRVGEAQMDSPGQSEGANGEGSAEGSEGIHIDVDASRDGGSNEVNRSLVDIRESLNSVDNNEGNGDDAQIGPGDEVQHAAVDQDQSSCMDEGNKGQGQDEGQSHGALEESGTSGSSSTADKRADNVDAASPRDADGKQMDEDDCADSFAEGASKGAPESQQNASQAQSTEGGKKRSAAPTQAPFRGPWNKGLKNGLTDEGIPYERKRAQTKCSIASIGLRAETKRTAGSMPKLTLRSGEKDSNTNEVRSGISASSLRARRDRAVRMLGPQPKKPVEGDVEAMSVTPRYVDGSRRSITAPGGAKLPLSSLSSSSSSASSAFFSSPPLSDAFPTSVTALHGWGDGRESLMGPEMPWEDPRICSFCHSNIEDAVTGGSLSFHDGGVAHVNCLRWSAEVSEQDHSLLKVNQARKRISTSTNCSLCLKKGGTVGCYQKTCKRSYHLRCAFAAKCALLEAEYCGKSNRSGLQRKRQPRRDEDSDSEDGGYEIHTLCVCPEHIPAIDQRRLNRTWRPQNPCRMILLDADSETTENVSEKLSSSGSRVGQNYAARAGACTVLNIGTPRIDLPGFHTQHHIFPHRYSSARIFWSTRSPMQRTLYLFEILCEGDFDGKNISLADALYSAPPNEEGAAAAMGGPMSPVRSLAMEAGGSSPGCNPMSPGGFGGAHTHRGILLSACPVFRVVAMDCIEVPATEVSPGGTKHILACDGVPIAGMRPGGIILARDIDVAYATITSAVRRINKRAPNVVPRKHHCTYGLNACQFFGLGIPGVKRAIELMPESTAAMIAVPPAPQYVPCYRLPTSTDVNITQQQQVSAKVPQRPSVNGCARADGIEVQSKPASGVRVTRILAKAAEAQGPEAETQPETREDEASENRRETEYHRQRYFELASAYLRDPNARLEVRKSHIHNWGLFTRTVFDKDDMMVEYIGEKIRQAVADRREAKYEEEGVGSCYLFRLDKDDIVDATRTGGMARFINHCCEPNAYARIVCADDDGLDKHIVITAARDIQVCSFSIVHLRRILSFNLFINRLSLFLPTHV